MLKRILNNELYRTISYNGIVIGFKVISSFIVSKVTAIYLGPSGYALVGNFKNVLQGFLGITSTGFQSGVIKYIAESKEDKKKLNAIVTNVFSLNFIICSFFAIPLFFLSENLAVYILKDSNFAYVFKYLAILSPLISFSFLVVYVFNGMQKYKLYAILVSISHIINALLTFIFIYIYDLKGALLASLLIPAFSFITALVFRDVRKLLFEALKHLHEISFKFFKSISTYLLMATYSSILISLCYLLIRNAIIDTIDVKRAGFWEALNKISMFYMMFFSSLFTLYLLPKLAENKTIRGYNGLMKSYFKSLIPLIIVSFVALYFLRFVIIKVFLTDEFLEVSQYFYLQLLGDSIKIIAFSFAYQFHAKKMVLPYFVTDTVLYGSFYFLSIYFLTNYNLNGIFYAYLTSVFLYLAAVCTFVFTNQKKYLKH
ncbi:O-antigen translocase [Gaetbulibacter saemankumensis]|uniref:O-antigen translocase n=1 Tax=Gaetbulibacter saemankumensis TaxID=311208 RepID=UPI000401F295|nr:O-antigen translocase [Gaetbulibacter saemankumensis]